MKERFEGANRPRLIEALKDQEFICGSPALAAAIADIGELMEFKKGEYLIRQDGVDDDVFMIVAGDAAVVINGNHSQTRKAREHVGEMAAIEPSQKRSASIVAMDTLVAVRINNQQFAQIGERFPQIWKPIARTLSRRLFDRNKDIPVPNEVPNAFIMSSSEALPIAEAVQSQLQPDLFTNIWSDGTFFAGGYVLDALDKALDATDFGIAIAQADDVVRSRGRQYKTLRDNVLFELGLSMGRLTRFRTFLVHPKVKDLKLPSDLQGLTLCSYDPKETDLDVAVKNACDEILKVADVLKVKNAKAPF